MNKFLAALIALFALVLPAAAAAAPSLVVTPDPVVVPTTTVGSSSAMIEVELRNDEAEAANVEAVSLSGEDAGQYVLQGSNCGTMNEGETCQVWFWFAPGSEGTKTATLEVSVQERPIQQIVLTAAAVPARLSWSPESEDFGLQSVNGGAERYFQLQNAGDAPVQFTGLQFTGPDSGSFWTSDNSCWSFPGGIIEPGQSCWVRVYFQPHETRPYEAELVASASGAEFGLPLRGEGGRAELVAESNPYDFGSAGVGTAGALRTITLTNQGNLPGAFFIAVVAGGDSGSFELIDEDCSGFEPVKPGASCSVGVRFKPQSAGAKTARLALFGEDDGGTMVMLQGEGLAAQVGLSAAGLGFGTQEAGTRSAAQTILVENHGAAPATVDWVALAGAEPDQFALAGEECSDAVLGPGESCAVRVRFAPDSAGAKAARLRVGGGFGKLTATLSGTAAAAAASAPAEALAPARVAHPRRFVRNKTIHAPRAERRAVLGKKKLRGSKPKRGSKANGSRRGARR